MSVEYPVGYYGVDAEGAEKLIEENSKNTNFIILDFRTESEFSAGHIENSVNIDYEALTFEDELKKLDRTKTYLIYCRNGRKSSGALPIFERLKFEKILNMENGVYEWNQKAYLLVK